MTDKEKLENIKLAGEFIGRILQIPQTKDKQAWKTLHGEKTHAGLFFTISNILQTYGFDIEVKK